MKGGVRVNNCVPNEGLEDPKDNPCWKGYKPVGTKKKAGRTVPNCVPNESQELEEKWTQKYKSSINCSNPKGFSQKAHCAGKKK
jgi:hypothetical protein